MAQGFVYLIVLNPLRNKQFSSCLGAGIDSRVMVCVGLSIHGVLVCCGLLLRLTYGTKGPSQPCEGL